MTADFDPHREWLGILPHERPVDHYRLLGLVRFEGDPDVIRAAADERMAYVRKFQLGPKSVYTQQMLNDLAAAKLCLLDPSTRATYDATLQTQQPTGPTPTSTVGHSQATAAVHPVTPAGRPPLPSSMPETQGVEAEEVYMDEEPLHLRTWFLAVVIGGIALVTSLALGLGILLWKKKAAESTATELLEQPPSVVTSVPEVEFQEEPVLVYPEASGEVNLTAASAVIRGGLQLVIRGGENAIAGWTSPECIAKWRFKVLESGIYRIELTYAVTSDADGSIYTVGIDDEHTSENISMRDGPGAFKTDELFLPILSAGEHTLIVRTDTPTAQGLMELRSLRLAPRE